MCEAQSTLLLHDPIPTKCLFGSHHISSRRAEALVCICKPKACHSRISVEYFYVPGTVHSIALAKPFVGISSQLYFRCLDEKSIEAHIGISRDVLGLTYMGRKLVRIPVKHKG